MIINFKEFTAFNEGIDIDQNTRTISFNPRHQNNVDTNDLLKLYLVYNDRNFGRIYSIFERKRNVDSAENFDCNLLVYAFKGLNGWKFKHATDKSELVRIIIRTSRLLSSNFDALVMTPSTNKFNNEVFEIVYTGGIQEVWLGKAEEIILCSVPVSECHHGIANLKKRKRA